MSDPSHTSWRPKLGRRSCVAPVVALLVALLTLACGRGEPSHADPLQIGAETLEFELGQRATTTVPGVMGRISLTLGDVETAVGVEDVEVIDHKDESVVASSRQMRPGDALRFEIDGTSYTVELVDYDATHIVSDTATFTLRLRR